MNKKLVAVAVALILASGIGFYTLSGNTAVEEANMRTYQVGPAVISVSPGVTLQEDVKTCPCGCGMVVPADAVDCGCGAGGRVL